MRLLDADLDPGPWGDALVRLHQARITRLGTGQKDKVIPWEKPPRPGGYPLSAEKYSAQPFHSPKMPDEKRRLD